MERSDRPSYADLVYEILRAAGQPLTFQEIFEEVDRRRPVDTRDPKGTIRNVLSQGRQLASLGDGRYGYLPHLIAGSLLRQPLTEKKPAGHPLIYPDEIRHALWPGFFETRKRRTDRPAQVRLPNGDEVELFEDFFGRGVWGSRMPEGLRRYLVENRAEAGDSLLIRVLDGEAARCEARFEAHRKRDDAAVARRNRELASATYQIAHSILHRIRARQVFIWDLVFDLLARGFYRADVAPDPLRTLLENNPRFVYAGMHAWTLAEIVTPELREAIRKMKQLESQLPAPAVRAPAAVPKAPSPLPTHLTVGRTPAGMGAVQTADTHLIERSVELKGDLLKFARGPRFRRALGQAYRDRFGARTMADQGDVANFYDHFLLQQRLPDGKTVVEHFVASHPELPERERAMLLGWQDVVEGVFEVKGRDRDALVAFNLIDELTYRVRSNLGPGALDRMPAGSFVISRLVPVGDEWLMSGVSGLLSASQRDDAYLLARDTALGHPRLAFRNPKKLERAWEAQREDRRAFIAFFGSDEVVLPGRQVAERMRAFRHFQMHELRDAQGKSMADRAKEAHGMVPREAEMKLPDNLLRAETVGIIYDEVDGLHFLTNFGLVEETFADPTKAADRRHREAVIGYLEEPSMPPLAFRRLAQRDPERASLVFRQVLKQPGFIWEREGEALLRRHKAGYFERPRLPGINPLSPALAGLAPRDRT